jgi:hypothetical protein
VPLGSAASFAVLAGSTVTNDGAETNVIGNLGVSPGSQVTGFSAGTGTVSGGGAIYAADATAAQAQVDLTAAYDNAANRANSTAVLADIGERTIVPGLYKASGPLAITGTVTLDGGGDPNSVFIFQIPTSLTTSTDSAVVLINRANACNVFWQIGTAATINAGSAFNGTVLAQTSITLGTGASVNGRLLARTGAVSLLSNIIQDVGP